MSFGEGPFGVVSIGIPVDPVEGMSRVELSSSRKIDRVGDYEIAKDGSFSSMDDTMQRVKLALAYKFTMPKLVGGSFSNTVTQDIKTALAELTQTRSPVIRVDSIDVDHQGGTSFVSITFTNLRTNTQQTVEA